MATAVKIWIEGDGVLKTFVRHLTLYDYLDTQRARLSLLRLIERENTPVTPKLIEYSLDRRKSDIQWTWVYIPAALSIFLPLSILIPAFRFPDPRLLWAAVIMLIVTVIWFRFTFFGQYLEACRHLYLAGNLLLEEISTKQTAPQQEIVQKDEKQAALPAEARKDAELTNLPAALTKDASFTSAVMKQETVQAEGNQEEKVQAGASKQAGSPDESYDATTAFFGKGSINIFLIGELIKKEAGQPNIYNGDLHKTVLYCAHVTVCKPKNILDKVKFYQSRKSIAIQTPNARATHRKYLEILLTHYEEINDDTLYKIAEDLQSYIEQLPYRKD